MGASPSTSSSSSTRHGGEHDVFLSFRGEDTRDNFISHLCDAFSRKNIKTFKDHQLKRGDEISFALSRAIEDSKISIVIFSKDYASSKWCLEELVRILECKESNGQIVMPIFYHINPSDVRTQTGKFHDAFVKHEQGFQHEDKGSKVLKWRAALRKASSLCGWDSSAIRPESRLVDEIVKDVAQKLNDLSLSSDCGGLIGISSRIKQVESLLCIGVSDFRIVGIWGMGGIGKTTIAGAVFDKLSSQFDGCCFIANVREESEKFGGLLRLRDEIVSKILKEEIQNLGTPNIPSFMKCRLRNRKVVIVLDDVNNSNQLEVLAGGLDRFGLGSRVIITTRDKQLLSNCGVDFIYEVKALNYQEALHLFCKYAFKQDYLPKDYIMFAHKVVNYTDGNPLALKVIGSSLYKKCRQNWETLLQKLNKILNPKILNVLRISFDGLDDEEKDIFLDIACFFKGECRDSAIQILSACYLSAQAGLDNLNDKSLINLSHNRIEIHDLIQEMGWEIVRQESFHKLGERSRLHNYEDVCLVLKRNIGTETVKGMCLDMSIIKDININSQAFERMCNLRFLKFYDETRSCFEDTVFVSKLHIPHGLNYLSEELRYLRWDSFPLKVLPSNFIPEKLVELDLSYSNVDRLWEGKKDVPNLKRLNLSRSRHLTEIPDLSNNTCLEVINLLCCRSLVDISSSVQHLNSLRYLYLPRCESLRSFSTNVHFKSLVTLNLFLCTNLMEFPQISGNINELLLSGTAIKEVPSSIESLSELVVLDLSNCRRLEQISTSICKLKSLRKLNLQQCSRLESFPEISEPMECLRYLDLSGTAIKELPFSIEHLTELMTLLLRCCKKLEMLSSSICNLRSLRYLNISGCSKLDKLPENLGNLKFLKHFSAGGAVICQLPSSVTNLEKLDTLELCGRRDLTFPPLSGSLYSLRILDLNDCALTEIPEDIGCLSSLEELHLNGNDFEILPTSIKQLSKLTMLELSNCNMLRSLIALPLGLEYLEAMNCKQLQSFPDASEFAEFLTYERRASKNVFFKKTDFMFVNCFKLNAEAFSNMFAESQVIIQQMTTAEKGYGKVNAFRILFPGSEIPKWFDYQNSGSQIDISLPLHIRCNRKLMGFVLCLLISFDEYHNDNLELVVHYETRVSSSRVTKMCYALNFSDEVFISLDHIILGYNNFSNFDDMLSRSDCTTISITFTFDLEDNNQNKHVRKGWEVKNCGICPIYAEFSRSGIGGFNDEEGVEPNPKRICNEANRWS